MEAWELAEIVREAIDGDVQIRAAIPMGDSLLSVACGDGSEHTISFVCQRGPTEPGEESGQ